MRYPWRYDDAKQQFTTPMGVKRLGDLAAACYEAICGNYDISTGPWAGWRIRGKWLRGKVRGKKISINPTQLYYLLEEASFSASYDETETDKTIPLQMPLPFTTEEEIALGK